MWRKPFRSHAVAISALILTCALGGGLYWWLGRGDTPSAVSGVPGGAPVTVSAPLKRQTQDWSEFTGQFAAVDYVELRSRVSGYLTDIRFTDGQMVEKGELLFLIDPRPFEIAVVSARAKLEQASSSRSYANRQLDRAGELQKREFLAQSTLDLRESEFKGAGAADLAARAALRDAELNLQFSRITAPVSGRIGARQISVGNLVTAGGSSGAGTLLTTIVSLDPLYFTFDLSEAEYLAFQRSPTAQRGADGALNVPVEIRLMDETGWPHVGTLTFVDNQVDKNSGTIRARATLANGDQMIAPGSFGRIRLPASAPYQALMVPDTAIVTDQSRKLVLTVNAEGTVVPKPVVLGPLVDGLRAVRSGLAEDDQVVINGLMRARPGTKVTAQPGKIG